METLKTLLDILASTGRLMYYTKGTLKASKELVVIVLKLYNCTIESNGTPISKEDKEDEL